YYAGQLSRFAPVSVLALLFLATVISSLEAAPGLATPSLSANAASSSQVLLKWSYPASGISGYIIEKSLSSNSGFTTLATVSSKATSYTDSGLASANTFYYRMRAYKQSNLSSYSPVAFATTPAVDTI